MKSLIVSATLLITAANVGAQRNPYVGSGSIGKVERQPESKYGPGTVEIEQWVGQRFILLPASTSLRQYGYQSFEPSLPYEKWVGTILTVTNVSSGVISEVEFRTEHGQRLVAKAYSGSIDGLASVRDLDYARLRWLGKSLWLRVPDLVTYDEALDKFGSVMLWRAAHVTVKNIVAGWNEFAPVRFILRADDGREGFLDVQLSGTNVGEILRNQRASSFEHYFSETDPRLQHRDWSARVWDAIMRQTVFVGMTAEQAEMSWGEPHDVNHTITSGHRTEQWVYGNGKYVYLRDGVVSGIQG
jgi:hypothetical protein